ncbi:MAG: tetratricopeptide repeat protein [Ferruginibacter sp.]
MMKKYLSSIFFFLFAVMLYGQRQKADSVSKLLSVEKLDTNKIKFMWQKADYQYSYAPDSAILIAQQGLILSKQIKYIEGQSMSLGQMANGFLSIGNNTRALEFYIQKLQIEEKRNNPYNLASATMNIGLVYVYEEDFDKGLYYLRRADSLITVHKIKKLEYNIKLNIGDVFDKKHNTDSAFFYFNGALQIAKKMEDQNRIGMAMTGLGHTNLEQQQYSQSLQYYQEGLGYLKVANNDDIFCEAALGLASLYKEIGNKDSAIWFARSSFIIAQRAGFQARQLDAANFLTQAFSEMKTNNDSALAYLQQVKIIGDSINSKEKIREYQIITIDEQIRQEEIVAKAKKMKKERNQQLQLLLIGLFIPSLFLVTLLLSRVKVPVRIVRFLGILSLLILFEYLTLLLHPIVVELTNHTPFFEMLIFVTIAALIIPTHHRIEHWLIEKLTLKNVAGNIKIKRQRLKIKKTS